MQITSPQGSRHLEGQVARLPMRILWEPGYDKMAESFDQVQHYGDYLEEIEQVFGCNILKTVYLSILQCIVAK